MTFEYRKIHENELKRSLFKTFIRRQEVNLCLRRDSSGGWVTRPDPFIDDWSEKDYETLINCLKETAKTGGFLLGCFSGGELKGFVSAESRLLGSQKQYCDLTSLHVSQDMRRLGIGRRLFESAAEWAREHGAKKLYISSHSAVESQRFYLAMGCRDAEEYIQAHVESEPYDRQLEYVLLP